MSDGQAVCTLLEEIALGVPDLACIEVLEYPSGPGLEERLSSRTSVPLQGLFEDSRRLRHTLSIEMQIPYWESVLTMPMDARTFDTIVDEALRHDASTESRLYTVPRREVSCAELRSRFTKLGNGEALAATSRCRLVNGAERHIPMLDFRLPVSAVNTQRVHTIMRKLGQESGAIVSSGRSYHYWGMELFDTNEFQKFLSRAMLLSPLVDVRYIAHRLLQGYCVLRISPDARHSDEPVILRRL